MTPIQHAHGVRDTHARTLIGVGMGPGDPELVTVKGVRVLREADIVLVPVMETGETGRAEATVLEYVPAERVRRAVFALNDRGGLSERRTQAWDAAAQAVVDAFAAGARTVAFATIGDPNVYSTFTYLAQTVRELAPDTVVETVPGVTAMQDLAARSGTVLCEGNESLALFPMPAGAEAYEKILDAFDTVVVYKGGRWMPQALEIARRRGRLDDAVVGARLGLADEDVRRAADLADGEELPYLSTLIVPAQARDRRGGKL